MPDTVQSSEQVSANSSCEGSYSLIGYTVYGPAAGLGLCITKAASKQAGLAGFGPGGLV